MRFNLSYIQAHSKQLFHRLRWNGTIRCPHCGSIYIHPGSTNHRCRSCHKIFSDTSGTIFHATKLSPLKILSAIYYLLESPRGISSYTLAKYISVSQPTAWRLLHIIRSHMHQTLEASGDIIIDEVYVGANWHFIPKYRKVQAVKRLEVRKRQENPKWTAPLNPATWKRLNYQAASEDKMVVVGFRDIKKGKIELMHLDTFNQDSLLDLLKTRNKGIIRIITDESPVYDIVTDKDRMESNGLKVLYRSTCNHKKSQYKSEDGYTSNPIENTFSQIRRKWHGINQWWTKKYCQFYMDEIAFRLNYRDLPIYERILSLFCLIVPNMG